jgi:hypothetical protein
VQGRPHAEYYSPSHDIQQFVDNRSDVQNVTNNGDLTSRHLASRDGSARSVSSVPPDEPQHRASITNSVLALNNTSTRSAALPDRTSHHQLPPVARQIVHKFAFDTQIASQQVHHATHTVTVITPDISAQLQEQILSGLAHLDAVNAGLRHLQTLQQSTRVHDAEQLAVESAYLAKAYEAQVQLMQYHQSSSSSTQTHVANAEQLLKQLIETYQQHNREQQHGQTESVDAKSNGTKQDQLEPQGLYMTWWL